VEKLLTIRQLSDLIQVSPKTIYQWTHIGFMPYYKFPKGVRFRTAEVEKWLEKRKHNGREKYCLQVNVE
jgi:excisionase family DNA binding protein